MLSSSVLAATLGLLSVGPAPAQEAVLPFPMDVLEFDATHSDVVLVPRLDQFQVLTALAKVTLTGMTLPGGEVVDLELTRISVDRRGFRFYVDGFPRTDLLQNLDLSLWKGTVVGDPASEVRLSFSNFGSQGWVSHGGQLVHLIARPDADGSWFAGDVLLVTERSLGERGMQLSQYCVAEDLYDASEAPFDPVWVPDPEPEGAGGGCSLQEGPISIETDYQLFQVWNDLAAETAYITTLLSFVSDRYEGQINTILTYPYLQFYTNPGDPWSAQDGGGGCIDVLNEFRAAWAGNIPNGGRIGHFLSGASLGCGVAWLDVLCNDEFNFSVSGNINGNAAFPIQQQPNNWDFMVVAHELGHNFSAPHTHSFCPPLDECPASQYWGPCQNQQNCITNGTVMSYCHLCPGGTANITTFFHPTNVGLMTSAAQACLPTFLGIDGDSPQILSENAPTPVLAEVIGTPVGTVDLEYRYGGGSFISVAMTDLGNGTYGADLPAPPCDATPEFYYTFTDATCGTVTDPAGAPTTTFTATVGTLTTLLSDDFETDMGWSAVNLGASTGDWQRGVPVDDSGWAYDPSSDYDGSGSAWLTQNELGNTDVDGGSVRLFSPVIDMTAGSISISYAYYLRLTNDNGTDMLLVEIDSNGGAGPWTEIARHDTNGNQSWRTHFIDLSTTGVTLTANMQLRFTANDDDPQSINEAGLDAFMVSTLSCDGGPTDGNYCTSAPNSTGGAAMMSVSGSSSVSSNNLVLHSSNVAAGQPGIFYYGPDEISQPFGNGTRCVGSAQVYRLDVETASAMSELVHALDNTSPPTASGQITAGSTWKFQAWFRDPAAGGAFFDLSDAYSLTFTP